jgi:hypothetical protein
MLNAYVDLGGDIEGLGEGVDVWVEKSRGVGEDVGMWIDIDGGVGEGVDVSMHPGKSVKIRISTNIVPTKVKNLTNDFL